MYVVGKPGFANKNGVIGLVIAYHLARTYACNDLFHEFIFAQDIVILPQSNDDASSYHLQVEVVLNTKSQLQSKKQIPGLQVR